MLFTTTERDGRRDLPALDRGASFIEVLVSIVLLGTAVIAITVALRVTVLGTAIERDHARAHQWLQSAVSAIREADYVPCDDLGAYPTAQAHMLASYESAVESGTTAPPGWTDAQIELVAPVEVWNGASYLSPAEAGSSDPCFKSGGFALQLMTIRVRDIEGEIIETVQVVKDE